MNLVYEHIDTAARTYRGVSFNEDETRLVLTGKVKDNLLDKPQRSNMLNHLETLKQDTGFEKSETLLQDIKALQNQTVDVQDFRIGEASAEVILGEHFNCRFYWNELRDARNPKGNKTGADLVGFIEIENEVLFLFGEVKTSSEEKHPPQVMTNPDGIEKQLKDLYQDPEKRRILISYLQNKISISDNNFFQDDFNNAIKNYYKPTGTYVLYGVLIRDTHPEEDDVKKSYEKIKTEILEPCGLNLLAIYIPFKKEDWLNIINGVE
jgi:hypothetical protein